MTMAELFSELSAAGLTVQRRGGDLECVGHLDKLTPGLKDALTHHRDELLGILPRPVREVHAEAFTKWIAEATPKDYNPETYPEFWVEIDRGVETALSSDDIENAVDKLKRGVLDHFFQECPPKLGPGESVILDPDKKDDDTDYFGDSEKWTGPVGWDDGAHAMLDWYTAARDSLPVGPFRLRPGVRISHPQQFYNSIDSDIKAGPSSARAEVLIGDLVDLRRATVVNRLVIANEPPDVASAAFRSRTVILIESLGGWIADQLPTGYRFDDHKAFWDRITNSLGDGIRSGIANTLADITRSIMNDVGAHLDDPKAMPVGRDF